MATYLCVKANNMTKSFTAKDTKEVGKPYLCVKANNSIGYFPLTTETNTGTKIKVKANNTTYEIVETYTTTANTSVETTTTSQSTRYDEETINTVNYYKHVSGHYIISINSINAKIISTSFGVLKKKITASTTGSLSRLTVSGYKVSSGLNFTSFLVSSNIAELNDFYTLDNNLYIQSRGTAQGTKRNTTIYETTQDCTITAYTSPSNYVTLTLMDKYYSSYKNGMSSFSFSKRYIIEQALAYDTYTKETGRFISFVGTDTVTYTYNTTTSTASTTTVISQ